MKTASKTDERLRRIQEILVSIKLIKLYTWEKYFTKITNILRSNEMKKLRSIFYLKSIILTISSLSQRISFYLCILIFIYSGNVITAEIVFVIITCYNSLRFVLTVAIPMSVSQMAEAKSSLKRIKQYLLVEDTDSIEKESAMMIIKNTRVAIKNVSVEITGKTILNEINFYATPSLIGVTGPVGGGKSSLLKLIMQDIYYCQGSVHTSGDVSYASQEPWLFPGTIKQNILFGLPYERERYQSVIRACALTRDLETFPKKDNTIVSDKGLNLSKGQQARINLARAVYKKSDIYLLDDSMSALDAHVSKFVFEECMKKFLSGKLCIVVCHNKKFLEGMERVVVIEGGCIKADGTFDELEKNGIDFGTNATIDSMVEEELLEVPAKVANAEESADENCKLLVSTLDIDNTAIYNETKQEGKVNFGVYKDYISHCGGWKLMPLFIFICAIGQFIVSYFDYYITKWLGIEQKLSQLENELAFSNSSDSSIATSPELEELRHKHTMSIYIYSALIGLATITTMIRLFMFFGLTTKASATLHNAIFSRIVSAGMSFFDKHLSGNILNRFSKDFGVVDEYLPYSYFECIRVFLVLIGVAALLGIVNPVLLFPTFIMCVIMVISRIIFLKTSRSLRRLDGITRSPVIGYLNSSLEGLTTIRSSGNQEILKDQFDEHQDLNTSAAYMYITTSRAYGFWLDMLCSIYVAIIVFSFILIDTKGVIAGKVGLAITQSFALTGILQWGIRQWTEVENMMTSVERVVEYSNAEQEKTTGLDPDNWPTKGQIEYRNVNLKYSNSNKAVLKNVNFVIQPREKVGIIGRTGAGKSSIISVLFRLYEIQGSVIIDNEDIKDIELQTVRGKISIIPQDPVLFAGTLRTNLDPLNLHTDNDLWNSLGEVELKNVVENFPQGLSTVVNEGGANFSVGQRQLICLARAILRNNKILVLDEATANIDPQTDTLIQKTITRLFSHCTILTIAHRLNTIINSDKIMVVDFGSVMEFDTPKNLLNRRQGIFYSMAKQAGLVN